MNMAGGTVSEDNAEPVNLAVWLDKFKYYRHPPTAQDVASWINRFDPDDVPIAAKILDNVLVVGEKAIHAGYKRALEEIEGWSPREADRTGRWFFVGFGGAGESGPAMLRLFREANRLSAERYNGLFKSISDLARLQLTAYDHVIFVDDFAGTGDQVVSLWPTVAELVASEAACHLILTATTTIALNTITTNTELVVSAETILGVDYLVFHPENQIFSDEERTRIEMYCKVASREYPKGYGELGVLLVLSHKTPNNSLPILHANHQRWVGLFPRYLNA